MRYKSQNSTQPVCELGTRCTHCHPYAIAFLHLMNLSREDLFDILVRRVAEDKPFADYNRTVDHAKWCRQILTGDDQKDILVTYKVRETQKQVDQRVRITNSRTQYVSNKVKKLFNEVHRSDDVTEVIAYKEEARTSDLVTALGSFYENKPLKNYISTRFRDLVFEDPNAYIIIEFENDDPIRKKPTVYPFEVRCNQVYQPHRVNGVLQYLITFEPVVYQTKKSGAVTGHKYTMYGIGYSFVMQHIPEGAIYQIPEGWQSMKMKYGQHKNQQLFIYQDYETKTVECPAHRVGYLDDPDTQGRTKVSPFYPAKHILTDLIWNKSEYDISKALHGFYRTFVYVQDCKICSGTGTIIDPDLDKDIQCHACKGKGKDIHETAQDIVAVKMPDNPEQIFDLSKMIFTHTIPEGLITKQREDYINDQKDVFNCIFGANVLDRTELVETATAKHYDWRAVNNTLFEYADQVSEFFKFAVRLTASHRGELEGLIVNHSHSQDFKLESIQEKIDQRSSAVTAGTPMAIVSSFDMDILAKQHKDDPEFIKIYKVKERFRPMRDKSKDERMVLVSVLPNDDPERVLYIYFERIFDDVLDEFKNFVDMPYKKQREIIYGKVDEIIAAKAKPKASMVLAGAEEEE